jgi:hypothetical protein
MVDTGGQLFTIEGIAASLIIIMTAYIVVNTTSVYTPGDTHISNMQLEVMGNDALNMMNTAQNSTGETPLQTIVEQGDSASFRTMFLNIVNNRTGTSPDTIQFQANVTYLMQPDYQVVNSSILSTSNESFYKGVHAVRVSDWVIVQKTAHDFPECTTQACSGKHAVLVEVLLWRD